MKETTSGFADVSDALIEEASVWFARMREPEMDSARQSALNVEFDAWLSSNPLNSKAYREVEALWPVMQAPVEELVAEEKSQVLPFSRVRRSYAPLVQTRRAMSIAASLVAVLFLSGLFVDDLRIWLQSDHMASIGERVPIALEDGSRLMLNADSAIAVSLGGERRTVQLLKGEAWFDVSSDDLRPFVVETPGGAVTVTGTQFNVRLDEERSIVSLVEGGVQLESGSGFVDRLNPGEQAEVTVSNVSDPETFDATAVTAWLRGQLVFYDTPLVEVVDALNAHRAGRIMIMSDDLEELKVSGVVATDNPEHALTLIQETLPIQVTKLTDYLVLLR